ncbi:MAG TPA: alpha/beta fold hydrolase [Gemmatimonadales bacterium]|nr:alpha/beta fold hydrolase [Gemmatimonadales bacterium]
MATLSLKALSLALRGAEAISPELAGRWAERLFFTPPHRPLSAGDAATLARARAFTVTSEGRPIRAWQWGTGPMVFLVHGWGGAAGRFSAFVDPILARGFSPVTYDGPGHGLTGRGLSSAPEMARALDAVVAQVGAPDAIIAHSFGGVVTSLAMAGGLEPRRVALFAPAADPIRFVDEFVRALKLSPETGAALRARSQRRIRFDWDQLDVLPVFARARNPLLVIHDRRDETIPVEEGKQIAATWPGAELVLTDGLGHRGVLRDQTLVKRAVEFVTNRS